MTLFLLAHDPVAPSEFIKDWVFPFAAPFVSLAVALLFFWLVPRKQRRKQLAIELWQVFNSNEMTTARRDALEYLGGTGDPDLTRQRVASFWRWALNMTPLPDLVHEAEKLHQVQKVLDFFAACDRCLDSREVDRHLLKSLLGFYFSRWSIDVVDGLVRKNAPNQPFDEAAQRPAWLLGMPAFRRLVGLPPPLRIPGVAIESH